jgi:hypothetical protein
MNEKLANEVALFVQQLLKDRPMKYSEVREKVMEHFNLTKTKAGNLLHLLNRRGNFLSLTFAYERLFNGVLYLPEHSSKARIMFREIKEAIPKPIRWVNKKLHQHLLTEVRKIKLQNQELPVDLLSEIIKWKLKISKPLARQLIGELEGS